MKDVTGNLKASTKGYFDIVIVLLQFYKNILLFLFC